MAGIKQPIVDLLNRLRAISVINGDGSVATPYVRIWNNQLRLNEQGKLESFAMPAFFVEVVTPAVYQVLSQYFRNADIAFKIHILHEFYNATDGTYEQDLPVFDLRDKLLQYLSSFELTACGPLNCISEIQDYEHKNVYHYVMDFVCNFTDSIASKYDPGHPEAYIDSPTDLDLELNPVNIATGSGATKKFIINGR